MVQEAFNNRRMDAHRIFIVTDTAPGGDQRSSLVIGPMTHMEAVDALRKRHPDREPMAVISLADLESTLASVKDAVAAGHSTSFEIIRAG